MEHFNWEAYKYELDYIFFQEADYIKVGTNEYKDFWKFFQRYVRFKAKKSCPENVAIDRSEMEH